MQTILTGFEYDLAHHSLARELADVDDRQLLDIGLVRAADGSLWLAEDPSHRVSPEPLPRRLRDLLSTMAQAFRSVFRHADWRPRLSQRGPF